jgi:hypothetical protein
MSVAGGTTVVWDFDEQGILRFGNQRQWGISVDDGCLQFHPQMGCNPEITSKWIWKEAFQFVERCGGFDRVVGSILKENERLSEIGLVCEGEKL